MDHLSAQIPKQSNSISPQKQAEVHEDMWNTEYLNLDNRLGALRKLLQSLLGAGTVLVARADYAESDEEAVVKKAEQE
ncbi:hypothetical protein LTR66_017105 [Elasticomyces elasticus]|nr:hypothetical protein LTR66_017105 [Elasticomyces elasticus]